MALTLAPVSSVVEKVKIKVPADFGKERTEQLEVKFKLPTVSEQKAWRKKLMPERDDSGKIIEQVEIEDIEVLSEFVLDISDGLLDEDGAKVSFSAAVLERLADMDYVSKPLFDRIGELVYGKEIVKAVKRKNS